MTIDNEPNRPAGPGTPTKDERTLAMIAHIGALLGYAIVLGSFIPPLALYLLKKDESAFVADQARESLNFQITMAIVAIVAIPLVLLCGVGLLILIVHPVVNVLFVVLAGLQANAGERYRYPFTLRLVT